MGSSYIPMPWKFCDALVSSPTQTDSRTSLHFSLAYSYLVLFPPNLIQGARLLSFYRMDLSNRHGRLDAACFPWWHVCSNLPAFLLQCHLVPFCPRLVEALYFE